MAFGEGGGFIFSVSLLSSVVVFDLCRACATAVSIVRACWLAAPAGRWFDPVDVAMALTPTAVVWW